MGNDELAIRFSNDVYATRSEVVKTLGTSLIDAIWTNIVKYRGQFNRYLSVRAIDNGQLSIVLTPRIADGVNAIERKLTKALLRIYKTPKGSQTLAKYEEIFYQQQLAHVAKKYRITVDEPFLHALITDSLSTVSPERTVLLNYFSALKYVKANVVDPIDDDFWANVYGLLIGQANPPEFYREHEMASPDQKALIGKTYAAAPVARIEEMMGQLKDFIVHADFSPIVKALIVFYYIMLVKPFETYSEEMALLTMKSVLAHADYDDVPLLLPLEEWLVDQNDELLRLLVEIQKTGDVTYLLAAFLPLMDKTASALLDAAVHLEKEELIMETRPEVIPSAQPLPEQKPEPLPPTGTKPLNIDERMALPGVPIALDEVDAARIEEHLMETNPSLKRGEAYFYARHCTIGKYYTISQFKKALGCAYETARTSMDHLAEQSYYRKESYKNKFIYTPIARK